MPPLLGLVKENLPNELHEFAPHFPGSQLFLHSDLTLFTALGQKKLTFWEMINPKMWFKYNEDKKKYGGNVKGEGYTKGAMIVLGPSKVGAPSSIQYVSLEAFGKHIDFAPIEAAIKRLPAVAAQAEAASSSGGAASSTNLNDENRMTLDEKAEKPMPMR
jgi:hypothetical protein